MTTLRSSKTWVVCRWSSPGYHYWPDAPSHRSYLMQSHEHLFRFEARVETSSRGDRGVEFHNLLATCTMRAAPHKNWGDWSCERIAQHYADYLADAYRGCAVEVSVFEDDNVGATVSVPAQPTDEEDEDEEDED